MQGDGFEQWWWWWCPNPRAGLCGLKSRTKTRGRLFRDSRERESFGFMDEERAGCRDEREGPGEGAPIGGNFLLIQVGT